MSSAKHLSTRRIFQFCLDEYETRLLRYSLNERVTYLEKHEASEPILMEESESCRKIAEVLHAALACACPGDVS